MEPARFDLAVQAHRWAINRRSRNRNTACDPMLNAEWVRAAGELHLAAERQLYNTVETCRASGLSWAMIGRALGVSPQAAQQRFSKPPRGQLV